jgi:hypothetical protein
MNTKLFLGRAACAGLFAALVASAPLKADGSDKTIPIRFGAGLSVVNPTGDFEKFSKQSFGVSFFGERELNKNRDLRGRVEYATFAEKKVTFSWGYNTWQAKGSANATVAMVDYIYRFESRNKGVYVFGGAGWVQGTLKFDHYHYEIKDSLSGSSFGFSAGAGYNLDKNLGGEISYTTGGTIKTPADDEDYGGLLPTNLPFNFIRISFTYRF